MNGYVESGYVVGLGTLAAYAVTLVARERGARRRLTPTEDSRVDSPEDGPAPAAPVSDEPGSPAAASS
ncbi:MAG: hypothetical protein JWO62_3571 [Acidimicrobiaceae bacterium]|nr:hypothetical protein [Acidimicrobiaceae bacterium]